MRGKCASTAGKSISAPRATRCPPASAWCIRSFRSRRTSPSPKMSSLACSRSTGSGSSLGGAWRARRHEQLKNLGLDIDPRARLGDFPIGVQQLVELSRVLFLRRADHYSRRADLGSVAAGNRAAVRRSDQAQTERPGPDLHLAFSRRHPQGLGRDHDFSQRPQGRDHAGDPGDRQGMDHRAHDRRRARRA